MSSNQQVVFLAATDDFFIKSTQNRKVSFSKPIVDLKKLNLFLFLVPS
jgi:hypothetical protein